jgi:hypothetical protein
VPPRDPAAATASLCRPCRPCTLALPRASHHLVLSHPSSVHPVLSHPPFVLARPVSHCRAPRFFVRCDRHGQPFSLPLSPSTQVTEPHHSFPSLRSSTFNAEALSLRRWAPASMPPLIFGPFPRPPPCCTVAPWSMDVPREHLPADRLVASARATLRVVWRSTWSVHTMHFRPR